MSSTAKGRASYEDVLIAPSNKVAEIIDGELILSPRPASPHAQAASVIGEELGPPFKRGKGGPGGWLILDEPELHLGREPDIVVPDLAGWRRTRMPEMAECAFFTLPPDWACEVLSESTEARDRAQKLPVYCRERVGHVWLVDPRIKTLEILRLDGDTYRLIVTHTGDAPCRAEPFDAIEFDLGALWQR